MVWCVSVIFTEVVVFDGFFIYIESFYSVEVYAFIMEM
jgi:hypothetical protein